MHNHIDSQFNMTTTECVVSYTRLFSQAWSRRLRISLLIQLQDALDGPENDNKAAGQ